MCIDCVLMVYCILKIIHLNYVKEGTYGYLTISFVSRCKGCLLSIENRPQSLQG